MVSPSVKKEGFAIPRLGEVETKFAVSYLRVSTAKQTKETKTGLNRQERSWNQWLEDHPDYEGWNFKFQDLGISGRGKHQTKGALANYLDQAERGVIPAGTVLVADSPSRLTREKPKDALKLLLRIFDLGHKISFCSGQWRGEIIESDTHGVWSRLVAAAEQSAELWEERSNNSNEYHREKIERLNNGDLSVHFHARKNKKSKVFYPHWLDFDDEEKQFSFNENAVWMRQVFEWATEVGCTEIAKRLKGIGIRQKKNRKKPISRDMVRSWLIHRGAIGEFQPQKDGGEKAGEPIAGIFPPLVEPDLFNKVQSRMKKRNRNNSAPQLTDQFRNLFTKSIFCRECGHPARFHQNKKSMKYDLDNVYHSYSCSAGYVGADEICNCKKRFTSKKRGVDFELDVLKRLQTFRWAEFFTNEKLEKKLKSAHGKKMRLLAKLQEEERVVKNLKKSFDQYLFDGEKVPERHTELTKQAQKNYEETYQNYWSSKIEEDRLRHERRGKDAEKDIQNLLEQFLETGRNNLRQRQEFSRWFFETGLVVDIDLYTGAFDVGIGRRENGVLVEVDYQLEHRAMFIRDGFTFEDNDGNPLDMDHFIRQKKIEDSKSKEQKIKESWEMINNPKNVLLQKAIMQHLDQLPRDSSEARNIRANLKVA